jgi:hypothetical protein
MTERAGRIPMQAAQARGRVEGATILTNDQADLVAGTQEAECYGRIETRTLGEIFGQQAIIVKVLGKPQPGSGRDDLRADKTDYVKPQRVKVVFGGIGLGHGNTSVGCKKMGIKRLGRRSHVLVSFAVGSTEAVCPLRPQSTGAQIWFTRSSAFDVLHLSGKSIRPQASTLQIDFIERLNDYKGTPKA